MKSRSMVMFLTMIAVWMNRQQQEIIEYLKAENDILREELQKATGKKRLILNDKQRRKLAILGKGLGRGYWPSYAVPSLLIRCLCGIENLSHASMTGARTAGRAVRQKRSLINYRDDIVKRITKIKNPIRSILGREDIPLPSGRKG